MGAEGCYEIHENYGLPEKNKNILTQWFLPLEAVNFE